MPTRILQLIFSISLLFTACVKDNGHPNGGNSTPADEEPVLESIQSRIAFYGTDENGLPFERTLVIIPSTSESGTTDNERYLTSNLIIDRYATRMIAGHASSNEEVERNKLVPFTKGALNNVRLHSMRLNEAGLFNFSLGGTFSFGNGGLLSLPADAMNFYPAGPNDPYYDPNRTEVMYIGYSNPLSPDFAAITPSYSMAVDENRRWFLASIGIMRFAGRANYVIEDKNFFDFRPGALPGKVTIPIPAGVNFPSELPNEIPLWRLEEGNWKKYAMAKKEGNSYIADIDRLMAYNLAVPVRGAYKTIRLRTADELPVVNATVRVSYQNVTLAEGQTDWDGNAIVFVPAELSTMELNVYRTGWNDPVVHTGTLSGNGPSSLEIVVDPQQPRIFSFVGQAVQCDGRPVQDGEIVIRNLLNHKIEWRFPVHDGAFKAAILDGLGTSMKFFGRVVDYDNNRSGFDTMFNAVESELFDLKFTTCAEDSNLYFRYKVDDNPTIELTSRIIPGIYQPMKYSVGPDIDLSTTLATVIGSGAGGDIYFRHNRLIPGTYTGGNVIKYVQIDRKSYYFESLKPSQITISRFDRHSGGFMVGTFDFYAKDSAGVSHHIVASCRLERI